LRAERILISQAIPFWVLLVFLGVLLIDPSGALSEASMNYLFVTGQPGCGKTTLIKNMLLDPVMKNLRTSGFITEEVLGEGGSRVGFDIVTLDGARAILARKGGSPGPKVGQYTVDVEAFEELALPILEAKPDVDLYVIDEIGRMELCSARFRAACGALLQAQRPIFGSIAAARYGRSVPYCEEIKARPEVVTLNLKPSTRDQVASEVREGLKTLVAGTVRGAGSDDAPKSGGASEAKRRKKGKSEPQDDE